MINRRIRMLFSSFIVFLACCKSIICMSNEEIVQLRDEAKSMFYHGYNGYMKYAYPADELMPLSCKGRFRDAEPNRGDIDDALGDFKLTLVDSLDSLVIFNNLTEFDRTVGLVSDTLSFDTDVVVSVFETNIRVLGGLLSAHILADYIKEKYPYHLQWYRSQLLNLAKDLGNRLLPAFNTSTGIPHPRINLKYGLNSPKIEPVRDTCTACAGTMILEFAALSRLTGDPIFELKARSAMDYLWQGRNRVSNLVGTVLNIHSGEWTRRDSGVGAGIDSYYEYLMKAYILLGDETYLRRFNMHYDAIMKYVSQGPMLVDVHMHRPNANSKNFMDSLLAFWPGLQVLKGDVKPAVETHELLYQVMQRHNYLMPEAFTISDFSVYWGQHLLRPEFLESTYFLYKATGDHHYLEVGKQVMHSMKKFSLTSCGFAAVKDVRTGSQEDRMDSFVLAETLKYLYLLFASNDDLIIDLDDFIFTTEAHLLPLSLSMQTTNGTDFATSSSTVVSSDINHRYFRSCPNTRALFAPDSLSEIRNNLKQYMPRPLDRSGLKSASSDSCSSRTASTYAPGEVRKIRLSASDFSTANKEHMEIVKRMGISVILMPDGRIQLVQTAHSADGAQEAEEGAIFMQEMIQLSKQQMAKADEQLRLVSFVSPKTGVRIGLSAGLAQFGTDLGKSSVTSQAVIVEPASGCHLPFSDHSMNNLKNRIAIVNRGDCMFIEKARNVAKLGAIAVVVLDNVPDTSADNLPMFAMSGDGTDDVNIPALFLYSREATILVDLVKEHEQMFVTLSASGSGAEDDEHTGDMHESRKWEGSFDEEDVDAEPVEGSIESGVASVVDVTQEVIPEEMSHLQDMMSLLSSKVSLDLSANYQVMRMKLSAKQMEVLIKSFVESSLKTISQNFKMYSSSSLKDALESVDIRDLLQDLLLHNDVAHFTPNPNSSPTAFMDFINSLWLCSAADGPYL